MDRRTLRLALGGIAAVLLFLLVNPWLKPPEGIVHDIVLWGFWGSFLVLLVVLFQERNEPGGMTVEIEGPAFTRFLFSNSKAGLFWLPIRLFLGFSWIDAGWHKLTGGGWIDGGSALAGYWTNAVKIPAEGAGRPPITYEWYRDFINFLLAGHHETWFAWVITFGELAVGVGLLLGALTGLAAFGGALMNMSFLLAGSASTNPVLFTMAIGLILAWKVAGYYGLDRYPAADARHALAPRRHHRTGDASRRGSRRLTTAGPDGPRPTPTLPTASAPPEAVPVYRPSLLGRALSCRTPPSRSAASSVAVGLEVGHEVAAIMTRVVDEPVEPVVQVAHPGDLALGHRPERVGIAGHAPQLEEVVEAERRRGERVRPLRIVTSFSRPGEGGLDRGLSLGAGHARRTLSGDPQPDAEPASPRPERSADHLEPALEHRAVQDRRAERATGTASVGQDQLADVAPTESLGALELAAEPDVEHVLGDDRVHHRALRAGADDADRAAALRDRRAQPDVDDVARRQLGRGRAPVARHQRAARMRERVDGAERAVDGGHAEPGALQQAPGDVRPGRPVDRLDRVAFRER